MSGNGKAAVAFLHPDLGIGGAERLVVDAALALASKGHPVHMFTSHHDPSHCFKETRDGTLKVTVHGDWIPRHIFGKFHAVFAYLRMIYLALAFLFTVGSQYPVIFCDQVSACLPVLRCGSAKVIFYCHFPDQLLAMRKSLLKHIYRAPIDWVEEKTTALSDVILVNSKFTAKTFAETFTSIETTPDVLYPSLNFDAFDREATAVDIPVPPSAKTVFLSINRFERKKNLQLALEALATLKSNLDDRPALRDSVHLIMAGGYDTRVAENVEHFEELTAFVKENDLGPYVTFMRSFSDAEKVALIRACTCLLYTPSNEHFGITPLEAMYCERPVIAVNSGGPLETIKANPSDSTATVSGQTGFLCDPDRNTFAAAMEKFVTNTGLSAKYGKPARKRVIANFSFNAFTNQLTKIVDEAAK